MFEKFLLSLLEDMDPKKRNILLSLLALGGYCYVIYRFYQPISAILSHGGNTAMEFLGPVVVLIVLLVILGSLIRSSVDQPVSKSTHGTSHFATSEEARPFFPTQEELKTAPWLVLGRTLDTLPIPRSYKVLTNRPVTALSPQQQEAHVLMVAPSGQGKTSGVIIPNLLREKGERSLFINDIKFELIAICAGWLEKAYQCIFLTPTKPVTSHHYNPLAHVENMKDAQQLAACLVKNTGESKEAFWNNVAELLITATILHIKEVNPRAPFSSFVHLLLSTPLDDLKQLLLTSPSLLARSVSTSLLTNLARNERLAGSIMVELAARLYSLAEPNITEVTNTDDINFDAFIATPTAIFISVHPSEADDLKWFTSAFTMQLMKHLSKKAEQSAKRRLPRPVALYLDEFGNQYIPNFPEYISLVRSMGVAILMAVQSLSQLQARYGEEAKDTILANASTHLVFPGCGLPECMYYSERLGDTTVKTVTRSERGLDLSVSHSNAKRRLMTPDEIRRMPERCILLISSNHAALKVQNYGYFDLKYNERASLPYKLPYRIAGPPTLILPPVQTQAPTPSQAQPQSNDLFLP